MGVWTIINAAQLLAAAENGRKHRNDDAETVETVFGHRSPQIGVATGVFQVLGALLEAYAVQIVYQDYKFVKDDLQRRELEERQMQAAKKRGASSIFST